MNNRLRLTLVAGLAASAFVACGGGRTDAAVEPVTITSSADNSLQTILERGVLRVGTTGDFYLSFIDPRTGNRDGYDIELTTQLAADMGVAIEYVATEWPSLVSGLLAGRYDITTGASYNPGRARRVSYSLPTARVGTVAVVRRGDVSRFESWDVINQPNVRVAVRQGSVFEDQANDVAPDSDVQPVAAPVTEYQEVLGGRADVAIMGLLDAVARVADHEGLRIAPVEMRNANYVGILVPQQHHELRVFIDAWIRSKEYSGYLAALNEKWNLGF